MAIDTNLYHFLHGEPNKEMNSFIFMETLMTICFYGGNAYAQIIGNGKDEVVALYPLMLNKMQGYSTAHPVLLILWYMPRLVFSVLPGCCFFDFGFAAI